MKQETLQLTGGGYQAKRRELDYYPTPKNVTTALMDFLFQEDRIDKDYNIWECACGEGAMSEVIKSYGINVFSSDISNTEYGIPYIDFLNPQNNQQFDGIITNPPFNQSEQFIKKALTQSRLVCMLLKSQYWHAKRRFELFENLPPAYVLPLTWRPDFLEHERIEGERKGSPTMEVAWSIWMRGYKHHTIYKPLMKPL